MEDDTPIVEVRLNLGVEGTLEFIVMTTFGWTRTLTVLLCMLVDAGGFCGVV